jgi:hypothetical protein
MNFLIDSINPQKTIAYTSNLEKIAHNLEQLPPFKNKITEFKIGREAVSLMTVAGRWILVYRANSNDDENTTLAFINFEIDINELGKNAFSESALENIKQLQLKYVDMFNPSFDTVELTNADVNEMIVKENLFACDEDIFVLTKANQLGALPAVQSLKEGDKIKVVLCDEQQVLNDSPIVHAYAFINFNSNGNEGDNGFTYLKIFDIKNNTHLIEDFILAIEALGVKFDRAFFMNKFSLAELN